MAGCGSRALPCGKAAKARREIERRAGGAAGPGTPSTAGGPGAKPLIARGRQGRLAAPSATPVKPTPTQNSSWPASAARSPGSRWRLSLHTSLQAEGAGSGLGQPRKGLPQCSGGLKGSSCAAKAGAQAEEAPKASKGCEDCQHAVTSHFFTKRKLGKKCLSPPAMILRPPQPGGTAEKPRPLVTFALAHGEYCQTAIDVLLRLKVSSISLCMNVAWPWTHLSGQLAPLWPRVHLEIPPNSPVLE
ncbi:uncharacterized protein LOC134809764 [Pan troglodytes]|uniref:uncharacterized protein LOC134809764 n=1 Tax=Pan troglodytes TaxID=9598 RepID=UPI0030136A31